MTAKKLICLAGPAKSGKGTIALMLREELRDVGIYAFADPFKYWANDLFNWDFQTLWGPSENRAKRYLEYGFESSWRAPAATLLKRINTWSARLNPNKPEMFVTPIVTAFDRLKKEALETGALIPRRVLQEFGDGCRFLDPEVWARTGSERGRELLFTPHLRAAVCEDGRRVNEVQAIQKLGGQAWYVDRPGRVATSATDPTLAHNSETDAESVELKRACDLVVDNDGDLARLASQIASLIRQQNL